MKYLNYDDMYHLAKLGAKVIQKDAVKFAKEENIKIIIKSLYLDEIGSIISNKSEVKGILGVSTFDNYIYLIGKVNKLDEEVIKSLMEEYNISINKIKLMDGYILIEVINGKRNFALNLIHHKFMNKRS
jgi:aspartokinase